MDGQPPKKTVWAHNAPDVGTINSMPKMEIRHLKLKHF